jgi:hypothetical protein
MPGKHCVNQLLIGKMLPDSVLRAAGIMGAVFSVIRKCIGETLIYFYGGICSGFPKRTGNDRNAI